MTTPTVALGDVLADVRPGFASGDNLVEGVFQIRMNNLSRRGELLLDKRRRVSPHSKQIAKSLLQSGDVLFNATNSPELVGKTAIFLGCDEPAVFSNHFIRLRAREHQLDPRYLTRWLQREFERGYFRTKCKQWVNQAAFGQDRLVKLQVPLPPIEEQRRIAAVLDAADALRAKRRQALAKLDSLTEAVFIDMFGNPISGDLYSRVPISSVADVVTGNTPSRSIAEYYGDHIEWIKSDNILESGEITCAAECLSESGRAKGREAPAGSTLVVCIAGSPRSIGRAGLLDRPAAFNQQINAVLPGLSVLPEFVFHQLRVGQPLVQRASTNSMKGMVSKSALAAVEILVPPIEVQRVFVEFVEWFGRLRGAASRSLLVTDSLLASLRQRGFRGEL